MVGIDLWAGGHGTKEGTGDGLQILSIDPGIAVGITVEGSRRHGCERYAAKQEQRAQHPTQSNKHASGLAEGEESANPQKLGRRAVPSRQSGSELPSS